MSLGIHPLYCEFATSPNKRRISTSSFWLGLMICFGQGDNRKRNKSRGLKAEDQSLPCLMALEFWNHYVKKLGLLRMRNYMEQKQVIPAEPCPHPRPSRLPTASYVDKAFLDYPALAKPSVAAEINQAGPGQKPTQSTHNIMRNNKWFFEAYLSFWLVVSCSS